MKMYQVFARENKNGAKWNEYSGIFESIEEAADCALLAADYKILTVNGNSMAYQVREVETEKPASRPAECINMTEIHAEIYEKVYRFIVNRHPNFDRHQDIIDQYGYDLYSWAISELRKQREKIYETLWNAVCSGDMDVLKAYFENGGERNRRYRRFGKSHSLIAGAFRNGNFETVSYLQSVGETVKENEKTEMRGFYMEDLIRAAKDLVDYFKYHNKNTTKAQDEKLEELDRALRMMQ